jgi:hypothetical protein
MCCTSISGNAADAGTGSVSIAANIMTSKKTVADRVC